MSELGSSARQQPEMTLDFQATRPFREGTPRLGGPGPVLGTKEIALGQLAGLCFNRSTLLIKNVIGLRTDPIKTHLKFSYFTTYSVSCTSYMEGYTPITDPMGQR